MLVLGLTHLYQKNKEEEEEQKGFVRPSAWPHTLGWAGSEPVLYTWVWTSQSRPQSGVGVWTSHIIGRFLTYSIII